MSFAEEVRAELSEIAVKKPCCRRALLSGAFLGCGQKCDGGILLSLRESKVADLFETIAKQCFGGEVNRFETGFYGRKQFAVFLASKSALKRFDELISEEKPTDLFVCDACKSCFLRGVFLSSGTLNSPDNNCHMEVLLPEGHGLEWIASVLTEIGYEPKRIARARGVGLYFKKSVAVEDLMSLMGSHHAIFSFLNGRIERDIRNNENRATNCVARNIEKSVAASARQMEAIDRLMTSGRLDNLSEELKTTALLRYKNPDVTLDELTKMHSPMISRSGLNHRLSRLIEEAENL